jgi:hypothetical protein
MSYVATNFDDVKLVFKAFTRTFVAAANTVTPVRITSDADIEEDIPAVADVLPATVVVKLET